MTPPTILQTFFFRAGIAGVRVDPEHEVDLVVCDFYPLHQGPDHVPLLHPVGVRQPSVDLAGKIFQAPNDQLQCRLQGRGIRQLLALSFQVGDPWAQPGQARRELLLLEEPLSVAVNQPRPPLPSLTKLALDGGKRGALGTCIGLYPAPLLLRQPLGVGQQGTDFLPHRQLQ